MAGYTFAIVYLLYEKLGEPCYASERKGLEADISQLRAKIETLVADHSAEKETLIAEHSMKLEDLTSLLNTQNAQVKQLSEKASSLALRGLENYPKVQIEWLEKGIKTVSLGEIEVVTGHSRRTINAAIKSGKLSKDNRNKDLVRVSSVVEWLKVCPLPDVSIQPSNGHVIERSIDRNDRSNGHSKVSEQNTDSLVPLTI